MPSSQLQQQLDPLRRKQHMQLTAMLQQCAAGALAAGNACTEMRFEYKLDEGEREEGLKATRAKAAAGNCRCAREGLCWVQLALDSADSRYLQASMHLPLPSKAKPFLHVLPLNASCCYHDWSLRDAKPCRPGQLLPGAAPRGRRRVTLTRGMLPSRYKSTLLIFLG